MNNRNQLAITTFSLCFLFAQATIAQPTPTASPIPPLASTLSTQDQRELERLRQEKRVQELVEKNINDSQDINDRIQSEVDRAFSRTTTLLNVLLVILTLFPVLAVLGFWLLRRSVISQLLSDITKSSEEIRRELADQISHSKQEIEDIKIEAKTQLESMVVEAKDVLSELRNQIAIAQTELDSLKLETTSQLKNLFLTAQKEKDQIFQELSKITPSSIQAEGVPPEVRQKIQELTGQLELLRSTNPQLSLSAHDYVKQGDAFYFEQRYEDALNSFEKASQLNPNLSEAWIGKARALRQLKRYEEAIAANDQAIQIQPMNPWSWFERAYALLNLKQYREAITYYEKAIQLNPKSHSGWKHRGYTLIKLCQYEEAFSSLKKALELNPNSGGTYYNQAYYYISQGEISVAIECLKKAIHLSPKLKQIAKTDPDFDVIREDDRFKQLIEEAPNSGV
jgi:tetratricopeptide (TPR) repeat protein